MGFFLRTCVEMREPIELSFGLVSGVSPGIHVLDGGSRAKKEGAVWGIFLHFKISL